MAGPTTCRAEHEDCHDSSTLLGPPVEAHCLVSGVGVKVGPCAIPPHLLSLQGPEPGAVRQPPAGNRVQVASVLSPHRGWLSPAQVPTAGQARVGVWLQPVSTNQVWGYAHRLYSPCQILWHPQTVITMPGIVACLLVLLTDTYNGLRHVRLTLACAHPRRSACQLFWPMETWPHGKMAP